MSRLPRVSVRVVGWRVALLVVAACGGGSGANVPSSTAPITLPPAANESTPRRVRRFVAPTSTQTAIPPARAVFMPIASSDWEPNDKLAVDPGGMYSLMVGARGERWLAGRDRSLRAARSLAGDSLVAARRRGTGGFTFLDISGTTWFARAPLADFETKRTPSVRFRSAAAGRDAIVGVTIDDGLVRSTDDGATWQLLALANEHAIPMRITMNARGEGVLEVVAGRPWVTLDDGATFAPLAKTDGFAPGAPRLDTNLDIVLRGNAVGKKTYEGGALLDKIDLRLVRAPSGVALERVVMKEMTLDVPYRPRLIPEGEFVTMGRGVFTGDRYLELGTSGSEHAGRVLGWIEGLPIPRPITLPGASSCERSSLAMAGAKIYAICTRMERPGVRLSDYLYSSADGGAHWASLGRLPFEVGDANARVFGAPSGALFFPGRCVAQRTPPCSMAIRTPDGKALQSIVDHEVSSVARLRVAPDGQLHALGVADAGAVYLTSRDGGRSFVAHPIRDLELAPDAFPQRSLLDIAFDPERRAIVAFAISRGVLRRYESTDGGATFHNEPTPRPFDAVALSGRRAIATVERERGVAWESADAGKTWAKVFAPVMGTGELACEGDACLLNGELVRRGWELDGPVAMAPQPLPPAARMIECTAGPPLKLDTRPVSWLASPTVADDWIASAEREGAPVIVRMSRGETEPRITPMFAASKQHTSTVVSREGIVMLRYPTVTGPSGRGDVELRWLDFATGGDHRAVLSAASARVSWGEAPRRAAWIVPGQGVVVRPRAESANGPLFFVKTTGEVASRPLPEGFPFSVLAVRRAADGFVFAGPTRGNHAASVLVIARLLDRGPMQHALWPLWPDPVGPGPNVAITPDGQVVVAPPDAKWGDEYASVGAFSLPLSVSLEPTDATRLPAISEVTLDAPPCGALDARATRIDVPASPGKRTFTLRLGSTSERYVFDGTVARYLGAGPACAAAHLARPDRDRVAPKLALVGGGRGWYFDERIAPVTCVAR